MLSASLSANDAWKKGTKKKFETFAVVTDLIKMKIYMVGIC